MAAKYGNQKRPSRWGNTHRRRSEARPARPLKAGITGSQPVRGTKRRRRSEASFTLGSSQRTTITRPLSTGLAADAIADVGGLRRVDHPDDLQLHPRRQHVEQPTATTEQHRDLMNL